MKERNFSRLFFWHTDTLSVMWKRTLSHSVQIIITLKWQESAEGPCIGCRDYYLRWSSLKISKSAETGKDTGHWIWKDPRDTVLPIWQLVPGSVVSKEELSQEMILKEIVLPLWFFHFCFHLGQTTKIFKFCPHNHPTLSCFLISAIFMLNFQSDNLYYTYKYIYI